MRWTIILSLIFIIIGAKAQSIRGTVIMAGVCKDGIVIVADSRGSIYPEGDITKPAMAYVDSLAKIFPYENYAIAAAGAQEISGMTIKRILEKFRAVDKSKNFIECMQSLKAFVIDLKKKDPSYNTALPRFFGIGYDINTPCMFGFDAPSQKVFFEGTMVSDILINPYMFSIPKRQPDCFSLAIAFGKVIESFAKGTNQTSKIGGPISAYMITKDHKVKSIVNDFSMNSYDSVNELVKAIEQGKLILVELTKGGRLRSIEQMRKSAGYK